MLSPNYERLTISICVCNEDSNYNFRAAFQYGVKMADGRKTRRAGPKDEKAELDRQWQKIQNILNKRKTGEPDEKKMKM